MAKLRGGRGDASPLFASADTEPLVTDDTRAGKSASLQRKVSRGRANCKGFLPGIIAGERVLIAKPPLETEKGVELRVRAALAAAGVLVMKHTVDACYRCRSKPGKLMGLGTGCADLICIVPPLGRFLAIEMKRAKLSRTSEEQKVFLATVARFGAVSGVCKSVEEAMALVAIARGQS